MTGISIFMVEQRVGPDRMPSVLLAVYTDDDLPFAAQRADVVSLVGADVLPDGGIDLHSREYLVDQVDRARGLAPRPPVFNIGVKYVEITDDREAAAANLQPRMARDLTGKQILELPQVLLGTPDEIAARITEDAEDLGFTYLTVHAEALERFAPVIARLRGR